MGEGDKAKPASDVERQEQLEQEPGEDAALRPTTPPPKPDASASEPSQWLMLNTLFVYCLSGTLLTLVNKLAMKVFPFPNALLVIQNGATIVLLLIGSKFHPKTFGAMPKITPEIVKMWGPLVLLFIAMLLSSLKALMYVSATSLIVMRNLSTLCVAFFERLFLGEKINMATWFSLIMILVGAIMFGVRDMTFNLAGYIWLFINVAGTSSYQIYVKKLIAQSSNLGPFGMSFINNTLSVPAFILISMFQSEFPECLSLPSRGAYAVAVVILSALLGFTLSTSAFMINKMISATSMMVANNVNKFAVIILSELFIERTLDQISSLGTLLVMFFGWFYSKARASTWTLATVLEALKISRPQYQAVPTSSTA